MGEIYQSCIFTLLLYTVPDLQGKKLCCGRQCDQGKIQNRESRNFVKLKIVMTILATPPISFPTKHKTHLVRNMQQLWLVCIPNRGEGPDATYSALQSNTKLSKLHRIEIPSLVVGTLDSLMALSDDLAKVNGQVEVH